MLKELPPKRRQRIIVRVDTKYHQEVKDVLKPFQAKDVDTMMATLAESQDSPLWQAYSKLYQLTAEAKTGPVVEFLKELVGHGHKIVVFAYHRCMIDAIEKSLVSEKIEHIRIDGDSDHNERHLRVSLFQNRPGVQVALLSMTVAGVGISLTAAHHVVFAEMNWTPGVIEQAEDRAHRIGQSHSVNIYYVYAVGTLDERLFCRIDQKNKVLGKVLDGQPREGTRGRLWKGTEADKTEKKVKDEGQHQKISDFFQVQMKITQERQEGGDQSSQSSYDSLA